MHSLHPEGLPSTFYRLKELATPIKLLLHKTQKLP
jgi:hypothetical protein